MLQVLHETKDYIVVNKPSGLITEKNPWETALEDQVFEYLIKSKKQPFVGVVHRLDRVTSGVILFAKTKSALKYFNALLVSKKMNKTYLAVTENTEMTKKAKLEHFLSKESHSKKAVVVSKGHKNAKLATLSYARWGVANTYALLQIKPITGRYHQIRVQLSSINCPIIGDELYGSEKPYLEQSVCLHAWQLKFKEPQSDDVICVTAQIPESAPWSLFSKLVKSK